MKITEDNPEMVHYWTYFPYDISVWAPRTNHERVHCSWPYHPSEANPQSPDVVDFYLWNITNPDEIIKNGEKPKLEQVGPFSYSEVIEVGFPMSFLIERQLLSSATAKKQFEIPSKRRNITFGNGTVQYSNYQLYKEKLSDQDPNINIYNLNGIGDVITLI